MRIHFMTAFVAATLIICGPAFAAESYDVRAFGAKGDGVALDTDAFNKAITAAADAGGGVVRVPAGRYLSFSIRLKSHVHIEFAPGAVIEAADPAKHAGKYDLPEFNEHDLYQDFGHSHWQNSLMWGDGVEDVSITGPGLIHGVGLTRNGPGTRFRGSDGPVSLVVPRAQGGHPIAGTAPLEPRSRAEGDRMAGLGNKAISLKNSRNIVLRDFSILLGGHFAVLATGVDDLLIDNLKIDTHRDGIDLDVVSNVRISNTRVNAPNDDAIVLKSSYALGKARPTENVLISNCQVSGYNVGTMLDGTYGRTADALDKDGPTGRIKFGTEANGGFRNVTISNCTFDRSRGIALESVDGGVLENVTISNIVMTDVSNSPIFMRLGDRRRAPEGTGVGKLRNIVISNLAASGVDGDYAINLSGIPGHPIENVTLSNIRIVYAGGGTKAQAAFTPPELEKGYPEPSMFGVSPAYGLYARHVRGLVLNAVDLSTEKPDARPRVRLDDVSGLRADPALKP